MDQQLAVILLAPLLGALVITITPRSSRLLWSSVTSLATAACLIAATTAYLSLDIAGSSLLHISKLGLPIGISFSFDHTGLLLAITTSLIWLAASLAAFDYLKTNARGFFISYLVTLTGVLGTFLASDLLTLLLFFELMTLASYILVIYVRSDDAVQAGNIYLYLSLGGSLVLVLGIAMFSYLTGTTDLATRLPSGMLSLFTAGCLIIGFGVKAGLIPLHLWLPLAHPVAPAPASAVLSGIMIKTGAYGILRSFMTIIDLPGTDIAATVFLLLAAATMLGGVTMALMQSNAKKMLAYHSISQMGYILTGIGAAAYLGATDTYGVSGSLYHIINHALFKSALFLIAGAVYLQTHQLNMYKLGGMRRHMPIIAGLGLIAAMGIAGVPGLNGYVSKTIIHHALHYAVEKEPILNIAEIAFIITGAGTVCSFCKFFGYIFLGKSDKDLKVSRTNLNLTTIGIGLLTIPTVMLGIYPRVFQFHGAVPAAANLVGDQVKNVNVFVLQDLQAIAVCLVLGSLLFYFGKKSGLFHLHPPAWLSVGWLVAFVARMIGRVWSQLISVQDSVVRRVAVKLASSICSSAIFLQQVDNQAPAPHHRCTITVANISLDAAIIIGVLGLVLVWQLVVTLVLL